MKIENLNVSFDEKVVFKNFNLEVIDGEITCILGSSGVGKTTLIDCLFNEYKKQGKKVSIAYQEPRLFNHLTVLDNLKLIGYREKDILTALEKAGLKDNIYSYPSTLSGGEKQRVNFVRSMLLDGDVLVLDEPFSSLDVKLKISLKYLIEEKLQKTIIFVTHDIEEALMLSNRIIMLKNGEVLLDYKIEKDVKSREYGKLSEERQVLLNAQIK